MPIEINPQYPSDLDADYPEVGDAFKQGDDHLRNLKTVLKTTFPNVAGAVTPSHTVLNYMLGVTGLVQTQLDAKAPSASPTFTGTVNASGAASYSLPAATTIGTVTAAEVLRLSGVTSAIQGQIDAKAPTLSPTFTGTPAAPTAAAGTNTTQLATTAFVQASQGLVLLSTVTASTSATLDIETTFDATYDAYLIVVSALTISTATTLNARLKVSGSYSSANYAYHAASGSAGSTAYGGAAALAAAQIQLAPTVGSNAGDTCNLSIYVTNPASTARTKHIFWQGGANVSTNLYQVHGAGFNTSTAALTGIRLFPGAGNFPSGTVRLYGIRNS
jgi:hypothetical protein